MYSEDRISSPFFVPPSSYYEFPNPDQFSVNPKASIRDDEIAQSGVPAVLAHSWTISLSVRS
jgi:hypothetical protein